MARTLLHEQVKMIIDLPNITGDGGGIRAGELGRVVWDEPNGDVIVEFEREVPNGGMLINSHQAWVPRTHMERIND